MATEQTHHIIDRYREDQTPNRMDMKKKIEQYTYLNQQQPGSSQR